MDPDEVKSKLQGLAFGNVLAAAARDYKKSDMETILDVPVPEGEQPKSDVDAVAEVLTKACPSSTFLEKLQRENEAMRAELAEMKRKTEESEAAQAVRDKEHEELMDVNFGL